jgi:hypothetical protein
MESLELFDNKDHAVKAHDRSAGVKKLMFFRESSTTASTMKHAAAPNRKRSRGSTNI